MTTLRLKNALRPWLDSPLLNRAVKKQLQKYVDGRPKRDTLEAALRIVQSLDRAPPARPLTLQTFQRQRRAGLDLEEQQTYEQLLRFADERVEENRRQVVRMPKKEAAKAFARNRPTNMLGTAFKGKAEIVEIPLTNKEKGTGKLEKTSKRLQPRMLKIIDEKLQQFRTSVRAQVVFVLEYEGETTHVSIKSVVIDHAGEFAENYLPMVRELIRKNQNRIELGGEISGEGLDFKELSLVSVHLLIGQWTPNRGRSYFPLPPFIASKKACVNPQNEDDKCFMWAILACLHPAESNPQRITKYARFVDQYDWSMLTFPVNPHSREVQQFEIANNISVNIYRFDAEENVVVPHRISKHYSDNVSRVSLLLLEREGTVEPGMVQELFAAKGHKLHRKPLVETADAHYVAIMDMSKLLTAQLSKHNGRKYFCPVCLHGFSTEALLTDHVQYCRPGESVQRVVMPDEGSTIKFKNVHKTLRAPFAIYYDSEAYLHAGERKNSERTEQLNQHTGASFHYVIKCSPGWQLPEGVTAMSPIFSCPSSFLRHLSETAKKLSEAIDSVAQGKTKYKPMEMTRDDWRKWNTSTCCHICGDPFTEATGKVRDHCHVTGTFRGAAHRACNLNLNYKDQKIPVFAHNARGYDWHLIFRSLPEVSDEFGNLEIIPRNYEQYIAFWGSSSRFLDSMSFFGPGTSLGKLVDALKKSSGLRGFPTLRAAFPRASDAELELLLRKGIFPYGWFTGPQCMTVTELPPMAAFHSDLSDERISNEDYEHARRVWTTFGCRTFRDYHDLYLKCDVAQLADVFEAYRDVALNGYGLDPCWYFSAPNMAWDAMLKKTGVELEQLTDSQMYEFFERGMRGGISMISHRHAKANNPYLKSYDPSLPHSFILYLDANNLYGWAMLNKLPYKGFQWLDTAHLNEASLLAFDCSGDDGMTVEVDLEYPAHLHDLHNDYPLAPEKMAVTPSMVSPFNAAIAAKFDTSEGCEKLIPNLQNKERYVVHLPILQYYIRQGLRVTRVHRAVTYKQAAWLTDFINYNTAQRAKATTDHEKDFWKLMNNSVFGKTMESVRHRIDMKVRTSERLFLKDLAHPNFKSFKIFGESLVACEKHKAIIKLDKPVYVGQAILDLSKMHMYKFWYDYLKPKYGDDVRLLATDTDSLIFHVKTEDAFKDMAADEHLFDRSEYSNEGMLGWMKDDRNKKVVGLFKDETGNTPIEEFVGLKPKMYGLKLTDNSVKKTCKGVKKSVVKKEITYENYRDCVTGKDICQERKQVQIRSENHTLSTLKITKRALFAYDTKRWILDDGINTLAHGHVRIAGGDAGTCGPAALAGDESRTAFCQRHYAISRP